MKFSDAGDTRYQSPCSPSLPLALRAFARLVAEDGDDAARSWAEAFTAAIELDPQPTFSELLRLATRPFGQLIQFHLQQGYAWEMRVWLEEGEEWAFIDHTCPDELHPAGVARIGIATSRGFVRPPEREGLTLLDY